VVTAPEHFVDLLGALERQVRAADHQQRRHEPWQELAQQQRDREDEDELVPQGALGNLEDDRQLAVCQEALYVAGRDGGVVHHDADGLRARLAGGGTDVVDRCSRDLGDGGDVVEQGGQPTSHESVSSS